MNKLLEKAAKTEYSIVKHLLERNPSMKFALMDSDYGPFRKHKSYEVVAEGSDWGLLKNKGRGYHVFKSMINENPFEFITDDEVVEKYEEFEMEDLIFQ